MHKTNRRAKSKSRYRQYRAQPSEGSRLIGRTGMIILGVTGLVFCGVLLVAYKPATKSHALVTDSTPIETKQHSLVAETVSYDPKHVRSKLPAKASTEVGSNHVEKFALCGKRRITCVVDGDTLWIGGVKYRIADIDTPEVRSPKCPSEKYLGVKATFRLIELLNAGPFELRTIGNREYDRYGRALRVITRNGHSLGDQLVSEGLAHTWGGHREPWCNIK